ncbi:Hypothetical_protein [Hexamita inflata]|uniref:Hypothetical_protein n=1 Tax=Hexamita inflata TaxID=28002 RepID=A0AA86NF14_9EUKA|nr:Hypothetical protein HINF_LOCUS5526 [Hexamita inflata]
MGRESDTESEPVKVTFYQLYSVQVQVGCADIYLNSSISVKHAAEPVLCSFIMHQYYTYEYLPVWSQYGIIGCQMTRIFSQAASSISSQSELQLRHLFSINVKMDNTIRIQEVLVKGALIVFCFQFFIMLCLNTVYRIMNNGVVVL